MSSICWVIVFGFDRWGVENHNAYIKFTNSRAIDVRVRARHFHFQTSGNNNHIKCVDACSVTTSTMWNCHGNCDWILANRCYAQQFYSHTHFFLSMLLWIWLTLSITCARVISNIIRSFSLFFFFDAAAVDYFSLYGFYGTTPIMHKNLLSMLLCVGCSLLSASSHY